MSAASIRFHALMNTIYRPVQVKTEYVRTRTPEPIRQTFILFIGLLIVNALTILGLLTFHDWYDPYSARLIATTLLVCTFVMLYGTEGWTFRSVGVLFLVLGDIMLYGPIAVSEYSMTPSGEARLPLARAFLVTGSVFTLYGITRWALDYRKLKNSKELPSVLTRGDMME